MDYGFEQVIETRGVVRRIEKWDGEYLLEGSKGRGVIEPKTRSLTTMAVLCTRNLQDELALHVRLGFERYGASREVICEVIAHCALYAGFPTAVAAFRTVAQVFATLDALEAAEASE